MRWVAFVATVVMTAPADAAVRFALVVGNNIGSDEDGALRWAEQDARRFRDLLVELGEVSDDRAILLLGKDARAVREQLLRLNGQAEEAQRHGHRTEIFFFYSGHGDADTLHLGTSTLPLAELRSLIESSPADTVIAVIDACRAGKLKRGRGKGTTSGAAFDITLTRDPGPKGRVLITSAGSDEVAQESDELQSSFFTHHLLSGLRGAGDADNDGRVTLEEMYRYTYHHTLTSSHGQTAAVQHPEMDVRLEGEGDVAITWLHRAGAVLVLGPEIDGNFLVVNDRNSRVVAELDKAQGDVVRLALPTGTYRIQQRAPGLISAGTVQLEWGGEKVLRPSDLRKQPLVAALEKGASLNPSPWALGIGAVVGSPIVLDSSLSWGAAVRLERELTADGWLLVGSGRFSYATDENEAWRYHQQEITLAAGAGYGLHLGAVRMSGAALLGAVIVAEQARRRQATRVKAVTGAATRSSGSSSGPLLGAELALRVPISGSLAAFGSVTGNVMWIRASDTFADRLSIRGAVGVETFF